MAQYLLVWDILKMLNKNLSVASNRQRIKRRIDCIEDRPHSALGNLTPSDYAAQLQPIRTVA